MYHDGIISKLTKNWISGNLLNLLCTFLSDGKQQIVLIGQVSAWTNVTAGIPQGSIFGRLKLLICINDLSKRLSSNANVFVEAM